MQKAKDWTGITKKTTGIKKILKTDFGGGNYTSTEKKLLVSSFGKVGYKGQNITRFNILNNLL